MKEASSRGRFIVFEGIDGSGKTTQIELLERHLLDSGRKVFRTAEPTDSPVGKLLRDALAGKTPRTACELASLFLADRISHNVDATRGISKLLSDGFDVICDRYYFSSLAYQGCETDEAWVREMNLSCPEILRPDLCIFLDLTPEQSMDRILRGRSSTEIFETSDRLARVRSQFFRVFSSLPDHRIEVLDAFRSINDIHADIVRLVESV